MHTPWGAGRVTKVYAPGVVEIDTPGHGGIHVNPEMNEQIPGYMRSPDGFYEEDEEWAIVATVFPNLFTTKERKAAEKTLRDWRPQEYEMFYGVTLSPGQSRQKDFQAFGESHKDDYIVMAAFGRGHPSVRLDIPKGYVFVFAGRGGRKGREEGYRYPSDTAYFFVPSREYEQAGQFGFVIDESRHQRVSYKE